MSDDFEDYGDETTGSEPAVENPPVEEHDGDLEAVPESVKPETRDEPKRPKMHKAAPKTVYKSPILEVTEGPTSNFLVLSVPNTKYTEEELSELSDKWLEAFAPKEELTTEEVEALTQRASRFEAIIEAYNHCVMDSRNYQNVLTDVDREWVQYIAGDQGKPLRINFTKPKVNKEELSGAEAVSYISKISGVSSETVCPLFSSTMSVVFDSYSEDEHFTLLNKLTAVAEGIGNSTKGLAYCGDQANLQMVVINDILGKVNTTTIAKKLSATELKKVIKVTDLNSLMAGALSTLYPHGYPITHPCTNLNKGEDEEYCKHVIEPEVNPDGTYKADGLLSFRHTVVTDRSKLTSEDAFFMSKPLTSLRQDEVLKQQRELEARLVKDIDSFDIEVNDGTVITVHLKVPSIYEYEVQGANWVTSIHEKVKDRLKNSGVIDEKALTNLQAEFTEKQSFISDLEKHSCWISHISITDESGDTVFIRKPEAVIQSLAGIAAITGARKLFVESITTFKEECTLSISALPNHKCPGCGHGQVSTDSPYKSAIPMNLFGYFFIIAGWRQLNMYIK